jgi:hypothetical protein
MNRQLKGQVYVCTWINSQQPSTRSIVSKDYFSDKNGFDEDDLAMIERLQIGKTPCTLDWCTVERVN